MCAPCSSSAASILGSSNEFFQQAHFSVFLSPVFAFLFHFRSLFTAAVVVPFSPDCDTSLFPAAGATEPLGNSVF